MDEQKSGIRLNKSTILILAAGTLWGSMGLFVRSLAAQGLSTIEIVFFRSLAAALVMLLWLLIFDRKSLRIKIRDIWCFVGTGIVSLTAFNICYFTTIQRSSMAQAAILLYTSPVFVVIFSAILFRERITLSKIIALVLAFAGCLLVTGILTGDSQKMGVSSIMIGIGAGVGYALYSVFGRFALERGYGSATISFYTFLFASIGMLVASPILSPVAVTVAKIENGNTVVDILLIFGIAIVASVLPYLFYTQGLSGVENGKAGIMASIEPVVAAVLGVVVFGERLSLSTLAGILLVLGAIVILNVKSE